VIFRIEDEVHDRLIDLMDLSLTIRSMKPCSVRNKKAGGEDTLERKMARMAFL